MDEQFQQDITFGYYIHWMKNSLAHTVFFRKLKKIIEENQYKLK